MHSLTARFMGPTWSPSGADRTQVGPMLTHGICYLGCCRNTSSLTLEYVGKVIPKTGAADFNIDIQWKHVKICFHLDWVLYKWYKYHNSNCTGWIVLTSRPYFDSDSAPSWRIFQGHGSKVKLTVWIWHEWHACLYIQGDILCLFKFTQTMGSWFIKSKY